MAMYLMLGKYSLEAVKGISAARTSQVTKVIEKTGGKVKSMYALLGRYDLAFLVDFPETTNAMKASIAVTKLTGIGFNTLPAVTVEEFDALTA